MRGNNIEQRLRQQDSMSRLDAGKLSRKRIGELLNTANPEEVKAVIEALLAAMPFEGQIAFLHSANKNPEWRALLKVKGIKIDYPFDAFVIVGGQTKHGTGRRRGKFEWIQHAFVDGNVLGDPVPRPVNIVQLTDRVNAWLEKQPTCRHKKVSRFS
jgi:hypothetical protein